MLQTVYDNEELSRSSVFEWLNDLKRGVRIFSMIQKAGVLQPLEMQTQSQFSIKWWHEVVDWPSEWCRIN
jgi:hypothetical protein